MEETTDSIRALAPRWSLAGDEKLLNLLQTSHQRIVSRCREINTKLAEMESALGETSLNLQNVNNKFMALSNSQFVECRVYDDDDDVDITTDTKPTEESINPEVSDPLAMFKQSLTVLGNAHEVAEIYDDSDTDSDAEICVVLKAKDVYAHRPLPYIIGTQAWKNKWHSGLLIEESDTDSDISKHDVRDLEQFSESDDDMQTDKHILDTTISESGSSFHSERDKDLSISVKKQTPADIAAELAARLGNAPPRVNEEPEDNIAQCTPKTVYRPEKPISSTIFSDEPPPIEKDAFEKQMDEYSSDSQEEDIFAEINKNQPYRHSNTAHNDLTDDLFGKKVSGNEFSGFKNQMERTAKQNSTLFVNESEPELFAEKSKSTKNTQNDRNEQDTTKKPIGGISLFGSNKGTESIGAAILKRNRRKSSASDSESDNCNKNTIKNDSASESEEERTNANDIFDNLFAKAKKAEQKSVKQVKVDRPVVKEAPKPKEVKDIFSDNIFDDIDDIFTSNIKIPTKETNKNTKSIFDDDDDLFSDIAKPKDTKTKDTKFKDTKPTTSKKSIFDSDDELFSDVKVTKEIPKSNKVVEKETSEKENKITFKEKPEKVTDTESQITKSKQNNNNKTKPDIMKDSIVSDDSKNIKSKESIKPKAKSRSIFDSDSDEELFTEKLTKQQNKVSSSITDETETKLFKGKKETQDNKETKLKIEPAKVIQSPSLFEEDEIDDLFINANKANEAKMSSVNTIIDDVITNDILGFENKTKVIDKSSIFKENTSKLDEILEVPEDIPKTGDKKEIVDTKPYVTPIIEEPETKSDMKDDIFTNIETENNKLNIPKSTDDIIETSQEPINVQIKSSSINVNIETNLQEPNQTKTKTEDIETLLPEPQEAVHTNPQDIPIFDEVPIKEKQDVIPEQNSLISVPFDDIFKEPPAFEKTKETKKTINVNALFEDDSDDEALFFKKNDVISDEKPEIFSPSANFGLFNDEPPAFVEFNSQINNQFDDDDLFSSIIKDSKTFNVSNEPSDVDEWNDEPVTEKTTQKNVSGDGNNFLSSTEAPKIDKSVKKGKKIPDSDEELFSNVPKPETRQESAQEKTSTDQLDEAKPNDIKFDVDAKKIGKINTKNFNINVQALVPGASPKKISKETIDTTNTNKDDSTVTNEYTTNSNKEDFTTVTKEFKPKEELTEVDNSKVKPISFESKPESGILDNNLSKQRPRIQVKRRPSSRRARHEAVRRSVIDIDDDTDNSSSFDEPLPKINNKFKDNEQDRVTKVSITELISNDNKNPNINKEIVTEDKNNDNDDRKTENIDKLEKHKEHKTADIKKDRDIDELFKTSEQNKDFNINEEITKDTIKSHDVVDSRDTTNVSNVKNIESESTKTTKVVYILNDEDIFSNTDNQENKLIHNKNENNETDDDDNDIFRSSAIKTIGNTYKDTNKNDFKITDTQSNEAKVKESSKTVQPKSIFDLSDDDNDLFGKTKTKKVEVKSKLFESDSEDDLFGNKKKNKNDDKTKKENVKGFLFGGDDDDDLFGVQNKTKPTKVSTSSKSKDAVKPTSIVFDDPLSMLDDD